MATKLEDLEIDEISLVDRPANPEAKVRLMKMAGGGHPEEVTKAAADFTESVQMAMGGGKTEDEAVKMMKNIFPFGHASWKTVGAPSVVRKQTMPRREWEDLVEAKRAGLGTSDRAAAEAAVRRGFPGVEPADD